MNFAIMIDYVSSADHLKLIMNLLCSQYSTIQYYAFNIFKVSLERVYNSIFVANPDKTKEVEQILRTNRDMLIDFLSSFLPEKGLNRIVN